MGHIIDLYNMTPAGLGFLIAVAVVVFLAIEWRLLGWYYGMCYKRAWEEERRCYRRALREANEKLRQYERMHRTLC